MSYATVSYTGNGSNQNFNIPFPYIDRSDIVVTVGGVVRVLDTHYSFSNSTTINILTAPGAGVPVQIKRETNINTVAVEFSDKAILTSEALNTNAEQTLYVSQELYDATEDIVGAVDAANAAVDAANAAAVTANNAAATANAAAATIADKANSGANSDITSLASPAIGSATATTQAANDNSTKVATTAYADRLKIATQVAPGTNGNVLTASGGAWTSAVPATAELVGIYSRLTSGTGLTAAKPSNATKALIKVQGAGSSSGAGGAGAFAEAFVSVTGDLTVTVGAAGTTGGASSVSGGGITTITAAGGASNGSGGAAPSVGDVRMQGGSGSSFAAGLYTVDGVLPLTVTVGGHSVMGYGSGAGAVSAGLPVNGAVIIYWYS